MKPSRRLLRRAALVVAAVVTGSVALPEWRASILTGGALLLFVLFAEELVGELSSLRAARSGVFEQALKASSYPPERPPDLIRLERLLGWKTYSPTDIDHRIRPVLRRLVAYKLRARHGIDLERRPDIALRVLPPDLYWLVSPSTAGEAIAGADEVVTTAHIARVVDAIEEL
jgi:hypothetical protein